jgi:hypothetical protein
MKKLLSLTGDHSIHFTSVSFKSKRKWKKFFISWFFFVISLAHGFIFSNVSNKQVMQPLKESKL